MIHCYKDYLNIHIAVNYALWQHVLNCEHQFAVLSETLCGLVGVPDAPRQTLHPERVHQTA